ncbi:2'-5' RNA ligase family protein [Nocardioides lianchengensis]|uniref:2'-5' RNA ligase superfamily protein n=1 Tax=Nocardioides lianchengensis TaxID=1045774 RepID=A0A1G6NIX4_9ACTN|nr:2'-5' RNA ligase family protein [Nocardioides lianchengensis]NYG10792.1 2'-5' RNA ligase [Nocardioides lianchengensis]SDC67940.1 2'-5' RNA ligase superfamily protein [Nocardioides lianchengensis]
MGDAGHSVLQIPVPELEEFVRGRHAHYDPGFVSADPAFVHAHVTALGPFLPSLDGHARERLTAVVARTTPFEVVLERVATFPDGIIHLVPEPARPFQELTMRLFAAFPECPPYAGAYDEVLPHLTLDLRSSEVSEASTRAALADLLPVRVHAERLDLAWWADGDCRLLESWQLGAV